jgi:hypothetical protein
MQRLLAVVVLAVGFGAAVNALPLRAHPQRRPRQLPGRRVHRMLDHPAAVARLKRTNERARRSPPWQR